MINFFLKGSINTEFSILKIDDKKDSEKNGSSESKKGQGNI